MQEQEAIIADIEPLVKSAGLELVEFNLSQHRGSTQARAMVYSPNGTGTDECAAAYRLIYPRLQVLLGTEDVYLEVSSPGIDRTLKSAREYSIFSGRGIRVLLLNETEWIRGRILSVNDNKLVLRTVGDKNSDRGDMTIGLDSIVKARLDSTQEGD